MRNKKGQIGNLPNTIMTIAVIATIAVVVVIIMDKVDDGFDSLQSDNSTLAPKLISANSTLFLTNVTGQLPLLGTVIIMGIVISSIIMYFWKRTR